MFGWATRIACASVVRCTYLEFRARMCVCVCEGKTAIDVTAVFLVAQVNKEVMSKGRKKIPGTVAGSPGALF